MVRVRFFPAALVVQNGSLFPTLWVICMLMHFGDVVFPPIGIVFAVVFGTVVNSPESHFGHDRAKNDSGFVFLV